MEVNRYLCDKAFDHLDHALGRPVDSVKPSYRNHYAANAGDPALPAMLSSGHWNDHGQRGDLRLLSVTDSGRAALAAHLREIGDRNRLWTVLWRGYELTVAAPSASKARYSKWLDVADCDADLTFAQFQREARVKVANR